MSTATGTGSGVVPPPPPGKYAQKAVDAIVGAYYPREVSSVDAARSRAQSAYAIASALAAVLIGTGLLTTLDKRPDVVKVLGSIALVVWLAAAMLYLRAVASPTDVKSGGPKKGAGAFVDAVLAKTNAERTEVDKRLALANGASVVALTVTSLTVILALFVTSTDRQAGSVVLNRTGRAAIKSLCGKSLSPLQGDIETDSIGSEFLRVQMRRGRCRVGTVTVSVPKANVVAIRTDD